GVMRQSCLISARFSSLVMTRWLNNDGAEAEPRLAERGACRLAHAEEHHTVPRRGTDRSIRPDEFRLALGKTQKLGTRHDVFVPPATRGVGADDGDAVGVVEKLDQPRHMTVTTPERRVHEHKAVPGLA